MAMPAAVKRGRSTSFEEHSLKQKGEGGDGPASLHQVSTHSCTAVQIEQLASLSALLPPPIASLALPNAMDLIFWRLEFGFRGATYLLEVGDQVRQ